LGVPQKHPFNSCICKMKIEEKMYRYQYVWLDHTLVRFEHKGEKHTIKHWDIFESSCDPKLFRTYFVKVDDNEIREEQVEDINNENNNENKEQQETTPIVEETNKDEQLNLMEIVKRYIAKFGIKPDLRLSATTILAKL